MNLDDVSLNARIDCIVLFFKPLMENLRALLPAKRREMCLEKKTEAKEE
jgi:hypothetical protein